MNKCNDINLTALLILSDNLTVILYFPFFFGTNCKNIKKTKPIVYLNRGGEI
jgi:hypothetical protein